MKTKLFLISFIFLFSSFSFSGEIHDLVKAGDTDSVRSLLEKYKNKPKKLARLVNSRNMHLETPLYLAIEAKDIVMAWLLLDYGAKVNTSVPFLWGETPLTQVLNHRFISENEALRFVKNLVDSGADVNKKGYDYDSSGMDPPLYLAIQGHNLSAAKILVDNGADVHYKSFGKTVLDLAYNSLERYDLVNDSEGIKNAQILIDALEKKGAVRGKDMTAKFKVKILARKCSQAFGI